MVFQNCNNFQCTMYDDDKKLFTFAIFLRSLLEWLCCGKASPTSLSVLFLVTSVALHARMLHLQNSVLSPDPVDV